MINIFAKVAQFFTSFSTGFVVGVVLDKFKPKDLTKMGKFVWWTGTSIIGGTAGTIAAKQTKEVIDELRGNESEDEIKLSEV